VLKKASIPIHCLICLLLVLVLISKAGGSTDDAGKKFPLNRERFPSPASELLAAANSVPVPDKAKAIVLLDEGSFSFDDDGRCLSRYRMVYRILTEAGLEEWASMAAEWSPWYEERPLLRARVVTPDGVEHILSPENISDSPVKEYSPNVYSDRRVVRAPLPALMIGAVVEREITIREKAPFFSAGSVNRYYFGTAVRTLSTRLTIETPAKLSLRYVLNLLPDLPVRRSVEKGRVRLTFEAGAMEPREPREPGMPGDIPRWPNVSFSIGTSWSDVSARYMEMVERQVSSANLTALVRETVGEATRREDIAARLLARLHKDVRYTGVEFGSAAILPAAPEATLKQKYGDCKDQSALLVTMLKTAGVPAHMALLRNGPGEDVNPDLPGLGGFNHAIVYLPGTPSLWIDPTDSLSPVGELPLYEQGRRALIIGDTSAGLTLTPETPSGGNRQTETREFFLSEGGRSRVIETTLVTGSISSAFRSEYDQVDDSAIRKSMEEYVRTTYLSERLDAMEISTPRDLGVPFRIRLDIREAKRGLTDENEAVVAILPSFLTERLPDVLKGSGNTGKAAPPRRRFDFLLPEPYVYEVEYRIVPPPGYAVTPLPESGDTSLGPMLLSKRFTLEKDGVVRAHLRFDTVKRRFTPEEFEAAKSAVSKIRDDEAILVGFESMGNSLMKAGKYREALAEFRKLSLLHPGEALHHLQIANALKKAGLWDAARREAEVAVSLEPRSASAHRELAWILQHDAIGRLRQKGCDLKRAMQEYRMAKTLDPSDAVARGDLAILLEFDEQGRRYSRTADVAGAIEEYRARRTELKLNDLDTNLLTCLFMSKRWKELKEEALSRTSSEPRTDYLLLALCGLEGARAAIQEAHIRVTSPSARREILESVGSSMILVRRYRDAADLLEEAARGASSPAALKKRAEILRGVQSLDEALTAHGGPSDVIKLFFLSIITPESAPKPFHSLFARSTREYSKKMPAAVLGDVRDSLRRKFLEETGVYSHEVLAEITISAMEYQIEGDDTVGFRVDIKGPSDSKSTFRVYITKEEGEYRIVTSDATPKALGLEVLRRVDANDLAGARKWLDWAREEIPLEGNSDPLSVEPFPRIWTKGAAAGPAYLRIAAATLLAGEPHEQVIQILLKGRKSVDSQIGFFIDLALARAYIADAKYDALPDLEKRFGEDFPLSGALFLMRTNALVSQNRLKEARALARERLGTLANDRTAIRILASLAEKTGDLEQAETWYGQLITTGTAGAGDRNNLAWLGLFRNPVPAESLSLAEQAVAMSNGENGNYLHTLSALYADTGRNEEARETLLKAVELGKGKAVRPFHWYVLGSIARNYGETDAAREAFKKAAENTGDEVAPISTSALARKRLVQ
jgi:tetratricopeptide (TPR) repeat protein/transglutaminase-like putative cysteine protease